MQSMDEIYRQYAKIVYGYLYSLTRDADVSEELTQETFCQAIRAIDRFDESCKLSTWLCAIARNVLAAHRRKHPQTEELSESSAVARSAEDEALSSAGKLALLRALHRLSEPYREVVYLRALGDLSFREIGEIFGNTETWARVTFYRGKEKIRKENEL